MKATEWLTLADHLRDLSWQAAHTCDPQHDLDNAPRCTACSLLVAARNIVRDNKDKIPLDYPPDRRQQP